MALLVLMPGCLIAHSQTSQPVPDALIEEIAQKEIAALHEVAAYRYLAKRSDQHGTVVRDEIDTSDGHVARLLMREDKALTPEVDHAEQDRIREFLQSPELRKKKQKQNDSNNKMAENIIGAMPRAMIYTLRAGQPQISSVPRPQIVIDFEPNPKFNPSSTTQNILKGIAGTMWVDESSHRVLHAEARSVKDVNFILGLVAKVYPGGKLTVDQREYAPGRYAMTNFSIDTKIRELMVKTRRYASSATLWKVQALPPDTDVAKAARLLLEQPQRP